MSEGYEDDDDEVGCVEEQEVFVLCPMCSEEVEDVFDHECGSMSSPKPRMTGELDEGFREGGL